MLALSGRFASSSPKGGALGKTIDFVGTAKASPFEERLPPLRGKMSPQVTKGGVWHCASNDGEGKDAGNLAFALLKDKEL